VTFFGPADAFSFSCSTPGSPTFLFFRIKPVPVQLIPPVLLFSSVSTQHFNARLFTSNKEKKREKSEDSMSNSSAPAFQKKEKKLCSTGKSLGRLKKLIK
jgi:hypothetical protein